MTDIRINELKSDIDELNELIKQSKRKRVQDLLSLEARKLETECTKLKETQGTASVVTTQTSSSSPRRYQIKLNGYGWDQSDKYVKIFVTLKDVQNLPKEQVNCKLTEKSIELNVQNLDNKDYVLTINNLLEPISVSDSHWKQKTDMVVIFLAKSKPNTKWSHMTEIEKKFEDQRANRFKMDDPKQDAQDSLLGLMKNMYESGDDDMKRMISKAWHEGQTKKKTDLDPSFNL